MTQRNPMNDRYQGDGPAGTTRKSAASFKPKTKAAASVRMQPTGKTKEEKKAMAKQERSKASSAQRDMYAPPTPEYKKWRRFWWVMLGVAAVSTALSWFGQTRLPEQVSIATVVVAYACIIVALYIDLVKIRKIRKNYAEEMSGRKGKQRRAEEKERQREERAAKKAEAEVEAAEGKDDAKKKAKR